MKNSLPLIVTVVLQHRRRGRGLPAQARQRAEGPLKSGWFYVGFAVYASTAFGWVYVMRHLKLATIGAVYSVSMILLLTALGPSPSDSRSTATKSPGSRWRSARWSCS